MNLFTRQYWRNKFITNGSHTNELQICVNELSKSISALSAHDSYNTRGKAQWDAKKALRSLSNIISEYELEVIDSRLRPNNVDIDSIFTDNRLDFVEVDYETSP